MDNKLRTWGRRATTVALSLAMAGGGFPVEALQNVAYAEEPVEAEADVQATQPTPAAIGNGAKSAAEADPAGTASYVWRIVVTSPGVEGSKVTFVQPDFRFTASSILTALYPDAKLAPEATRKPAVTWQGSAVEAESYNNDWNITLQDSLDETGWGTLAIYVKTTETGQSFGEKTFNITANRVYNLAKATMKLDLDKNEMPRKDNEQPESEQNPYCVTYTGSQFVPTPRDVMCGNKSLTEGTDYTVEQVKEGANTGVVLDGNGNPTYAGAATIVADGKDETYYGKGSKSFVIDQCPITGITWSKESAVYTGVAQSPTATGIVEKGQTAPAPSLDVYVSAPEETKSAIDVGDYKFKASLGENANYRFAGNVVDDNPWSFSITPASVTISGVTFEKVYDGDANIYDSTKITSTSATLDGIVEADKDLVEFNSEALKNLTKSISFDGSTAGESKNMTTVADQTSLNDLLANVQDAKKAKNYNVVAKEDVLFAGAGTITPKDLHVTNIEAQDKVYDATKTASLKGGELDPNEIVPQDDVKLAEKLKGEFETANVGSGIKVTLNSTQNLTGDAAGNYTLVMKQGQELKANITQAPLTVTAKNQTIWQGGSIATDSSWYEYEPTQLKGQDKLASALLTSSSTAQPTTTGEIVVSDAKIEGAEGDATKNYNITYKKGVLTVKEKQAQTITAPDVTATYGDTGKAVVAKTDGGGALSYAVKNGGEYVDVDADTGALTIKGAGKATVTVSATETADHKAATKDVTVTIAKAESTPAEVAANDRTWDGTEQPLVTVSGEPAGGEMRYSTDGYSFFADVPAATEAGEYTVWYKVAGDANHNDSEAKSVKVTVSRKVLALSGAGHVQTYGDQGATEETDGIMIGTTGQSKRLESFSVSLPEDVDGSIEYRGHVQGIGWVDWSRDGEACGTTAQSKRVEAVQMQLSGAVADEYNVWYRVHSQTYGWLGWATNGQAAGTAGQSKRAEAVEVQVLRDGQVPEGYVAGQASYIGAATGDAHVQGIGWTGNGSALEFGTTGQSRRLEAISLSAPNQPVAGGIAYEVHAQGIGWMGEVADGVLAGTTGQSRRLEAVRATLTGDMANEFSVWYRVHSQTYGWLGWAHDGDPAGTTGLSKRAEAVDVQILPIGQFPDGFDGSAACIVG